MDVKPQRREQIRTVKLSTDNPDLMPVTDAVYNPPKRRKPDSDYTPRGHGFRIAVPTALLDAGSKLYPRTGEHRDEDTRALGRIRRAAARRHQEEARG